MTSGADSGDAHPVSQAPARAPKAPRAAGNPFGVFEAAFGIVVGFLLSALALSAYEAATPHHATTIGKDIVGFAGLWLGFAGAAVAASWLNKPTGALGTGQEASLPTGTGSVVRDYGVRLRSWPDIPIGIAVGVASQFGLVPLLELPLEPFVRNLNQQIGRPAQNLLGPVNGFSLAFLAVLVCVGSPVVEELFFRGLLLRGLLGRLAPLGNRWGPSLAIVLTGLVFGLVHFERLQFLGLAGFGMVLAYLAYRTGRLGPSIVAHIAFNSTTVVYFVLTH